MLDWQGLLSLGVRRRAPYRLWVWFSILHPLGRTDSPIRESIRTQDMRPVLISYRRFLMIELNDRPLAFRSTRQSRRGLTGVDSHCLSFTNLPFYLFTLPCVRFCVCVHAECYVTACLLCVCELLLLLLVLGAQPPTYVPYRQPHIPLFLSSQLLFALKSCCTAGVFHCEHTILDPAFVQYYIIYTPCVSRLLRQPPASTRLLLQY